MFGSAQEWARAELIRLAEDERYGGPAEFDPEFKRLRTIQAIQDPNYQITEDTLAADIPMTRVIRAIQGVLESTDTGIAEHAANIEKTALSGPPESWYDTFLKVEEMIQSAARAVDGSTASKTLVDLVSALSQLPDLVNPLSTDLEYEIDEFWKRKVRIPPGAVLIGESGEEIWSELPGLQSNIRQRILDFPGSDMIGQNNHKWPDNCWENFTRFCRQLSLAHIEGCSPVSSLERLWGLRILDLMLDEYNNMDRLRAASVYVDVFGEEICLLCRENVDPRPSPLKNYKRYGSGSQPSWEGTYSLERWALWFERFRVRADSKREGNARDSAALAVRRMLEAETYVENMLT